MENASKALLIAAAVLIVILLIAFGMNIFNSAQDVGDASEASSAINTAVTGTSNKLQGLVPGEAREFNKRIELYLGSNKTVEETIKFAQLIKGLSRTVTVATPLGDTTLATYMNGYTGKCTIKVSERDTEGFITKVYIEKQD